MFIYCFLGYNPTQDIISKYWTSSSMTYQQFNSILSTEKLPSEQDLLEAFRYIIHLSDHLIFQNWGSYGKY